MYVDTSTKPNQRTQAARARSHRTKTAIADAVIELVVESARLPSANDVARRAGVSLRSVFNHFGDMESLCAEVIRRYEPRVASLIVAIDPQAALDVRVRELVAQRHSMYLVVAPLRRAIARNPLLREGLAVQAARRRLESVLERQLTEAFRAELRHFPDRHDALVRLVSVTSFDFWDHLTRVRGLAPRRAQRQMNIIVLRELAG